MPLQSLPTKVQNTLLPYLFLLGITFVPHSVSGQEPAEWHRVTVPEVWRKVPTGDLAPVNGFSWHRCLVYVPDAWRGNELTLFVEALDDARGAYFNGSVVGATGTFPPQFRSGLGESGRYAVDSERIRFGQLNTVAIRVYQDDPRPNFNVAAPVLYNPALQQAIRMEGTWQYRPGDDPSWSAARPAEFSIAADAAPSSFEREKGIYHEVDPVTDFETYAARRRGDNDPYSPKEAESRFETPEDVQFQLVLSDPEVTQPLFISWDARGRLWLMEYRQYPEIAGLKMVSRDVYLRSVYDKVPAAPPNHVRGRDRISIHEDVDGDGVYDTHKVFVDGLNLATSFAIGRGGVWVTNPPYLLFYPDRDRDDVPDGDPEVHLEGFGLEDSHSVINSLRFGPDGWLYAAQGSTVTARVRRPGSSDPPIRSMGQQIWRYDPQERRYETFAEGGGNTFGVEIDAKGRVYSGHNGGDTRGFHYVQGGYYRKGFGKHGPLSNPYAFGFFQHMKHHRVPRFTHNFVIYESETLPDPYRGRLFGIEPLQGQVVMSSFEPFQSSFQTEDISRPVETDDQWFRPVDIKVGPDGCIYVADMYEQGISHSVHYAGRIDRSNGRVYRLRPSSLDRSSPSDLAKLSGESLLELLKHPTKWYRQTALRILWDRQDSALVDPIWRQIGAARDQHALELLWALNACGGLDETRAIELLKHEDRFVRAWTVRLLCDDYLVSDVIGRALAGLAAGEPYIEVRKQLASSARRLPPALGVPIIRQLLRHDEDAQDIHQPLLIWWALESHVSADGWEHIYQQILSDQSLWRVPLVREHLIDRLMRRFALAGTRRELVAAARLLTVSPDKASTELLLKGFEQAFQGRSLAGIPAELTDALANSGGGSLALRLRQGDAAAIREAAKLAADPNTDAAQRIQYLEVFGEIRQRDLIPLLTEVALSDDDQAIVSAALTSLQPFRDLQVSSIVQHFRQFTDESRGVVETLLSSRATWAVALLEAVDRGDLQASDISSSALRKMLLHDDAEIQRLIGEHWGPVAGATTEQMQQEILRLAKVIGNGSGNPKKGKQLFTTHCGKCHVLFGEGGQVGPDLTSFKRDDIQRVLTNVVNPSAEIREGFENYVLITVDGRAVNGFVADQDNQVVVLRGIDGQNLFFRRDEIEDLRAIPRSVMPEDALRELNDQQVRDLFAYFRSSQPVNY